MADTRVRVRRLAPKTRTGCITCKRRRVKCDERKPFCRVCERVKIRCDGYQIPKAWIFQPTASTSHSSTGSHDEPNSDNTSRESSATIGLTRSESQETQILKANPSNDSRLYMHMINSDHEGPQLLQCYFDMQANCPMAWEGQVYNNGSQFSARILDEEEPFLSFSRSASGPNSNVMTRRAHFVLAVAALHHFEPQKYPSHLYVRYQQMTLIEIRKRLSQNAFDTADLLHGITMIFLATVLHGANAAARAHLAAARELVTQRGGLKNIDPATATILRYADFSFAVETLSPPIFPLFFDTPSSWRADTPIVDPVLLRLGKDLIQVTRVSSLPPKLVEAVRRFTQSTICLVHSWITAYPNLADLTQLMEIASHIAGTLYMILNSQSASQRQVSSALSATIAPNIGTTQSTPSPSSSSTSTSIVPSPNQADSVVILVLWCQLFMCFLNECVSSVDIRGNITPIYSNESSTSSVARNNLSEQVVQGLSVWNGLVRRARTRVKAGKENGDWLQLIDIVEGMEVDEEAKLAPFMRRLLTLRGWRLSRAESGGE